MSMTEVIDSIERETFYQCMNRPVKTNNAYIQYDNKTGKNWIHCPFCGKKHFPIEDDTVINNLKQKCKGSNCKKEFIVNV